MSACRRKKVRKLRLRRRRVCGGYMPGSWIPQPEDKSHLSSLREMYKQKNKKNEIGWTDYLNWYKLADKIANKNVIDEGTMNEILYQYRSGDESKKNYALDRMKDQLIIRDIMANPEDYIKEYEKGKHRRNNWAKYVGGVAEVGALLAGAYGATKLLPGAATKVASWFGPGEAAAGTAAETAANSSSEASKLAKEVTKQMAKKAFKGYSNMGSNNTNTGTGSFDLSALDLGLDPRAYKDGAKGALDAVISQVLKNVSAKENPGLQGVTKDGVIVSGPSGPMTIPLGSFFSWAQENADDFAGFWKQMAIINKLSGKFKKNILQRLWGYLTGSGFRVTRKGRHLVNRYRRHLRRRRR